MNNIYIYNYDLYSLLILIDYLINNNIKPDNIKTNDYNNTLFDNIINLNIKYNKIKLNNLIKRMKIIFNYILNVFLSNEDNKELIIYYFYKNYLKYGFNILNMYNFNCVNKTLKINKYVKNETHKYKGFIRFKELENNILYAEIEPVNNILIYISNHFKNRLNNFYWIIKDNRRGILSIYDKKNYHIVSENNFILKTNKNSINEDLYQKLWKSFYNTIGIKERHNERCRMNFMPKRYWKYLIEMSEYNEKNS